MVGTVLLLGACVVGLSVLLEGCSSKSEEEQEEKEVDLEESKAAAMNEIQEEEEVVEGARVRCTSAIKEDTVYILDSQNKVVTLNNLNMLSRKDIKMSAPFEMCQYTKDKICPVAREIEKNEWQNYSELNGMGEGEEKLDKLLSYMVCLTGCGVIYFIDSGQIQKQFADAYSIINLYTNEEMLKYMGWDIVKFKEIYGTNALEELKECMYNYGITNRYSVGMFLATLGTECGNGASKQEFRTDFSGASYDFETRGAGMIQLTGDVQKDFLVKKLSELEAQRQSGEIKIDDPLYEELKNIIDEYYYTGKISRDEYSRGPSDFIAEEFPIESAAWYWGEYGRCRYYENLNDEKNSKNMSINQYVEKIAEDQLKYTNNSNEIRKDPLGHLFLVTQYYVNAPAEGWGLPRLQKIAECTNDDYYWIQDGKLCFENETGSHEHVLPNGWTEREDDWEKMLVALFG